MAFLYNLSILIFTMLANIASLFSDKAKLWVNGRKGWKQKISEKISPGDRTFWIHCASLGEFEQGRPVIEAIRKERPDLKVVLTFFSPSGFEIRRNYSEADCVAYLPADTPSNASDFISMINPQFAVFVKYEFWHNYISCLHGKNIPVYLISAIFRPDQHFFRWYGSFFRKMLEKFRIIFVQDERSAALLKEAGMKNIILAGDTRFDRVVRIAATARDIPVIEKFRSGEKVFITGSSWRQDEEIIARYINSYPERLKWIFAPHETDKENVDRLEKLFTVKCARFSQNDGDPADARVLIIDSIGILSSAYRYAHIAAVGGGFGKGIHNILEAACWGIPVMFGPKHEKFREAIELIKQNGAKTYDSYEKFSEILNKWLEEEAFYLESAKAASAYVSKNTGATARIIREILPKI